MEKIRTNRKKRQEEASKQNGIVNTQVSNSDRPPCPVCNPATNEDLSLLMDPESVLDIDLLLSDLSQDSNNMSTISDSNDSQNINPDGVVLNDSQNICVSSTSTELVKPSIIGGFVGVSAQDLPTDPHMYWMLSAEEQQLINHLLQTFQVIV